MRRLRSLCTLAGALALTHCTPEPAQMPPPPAWTAPPPLTTPPRPALPPEQAPLGRLPSDARPAHVTLALQIDPTADRFSGAVEIDVDLARPRDVIWLHGRDLTAKDATVRVGGASPIPAVYSQVDPSGVVALRLAEPVGPGRVTVHIDYDAAYTSGQRGLYVVERGGKKYAFTQFEPLEARRVYPGFDEPAFKVPFDVTIFAPPGNEVIANTHETERAMGVANGQTRFTFATTAPLPTYLTAFAVGPFDVVAAAPIPPNAVRSTPLPLRGVAVSGRGKDLSYALTETAKHVATLETYFGIAYPFDKLDILAVPEKGGAMENPGAITFGEYFLLMDPASAPVAQKRSLATIMLHELGHQWFGNLVTMPWWDDIWLNEAFASWIEDRVVDAPWALFGAVRAAHDVMTKDSLVSARQVRQEVLTPHDVYSAFDGITYTKGGAVIAMFEQFVGKDAFRKGIGAYLAAHRGGTATADDLFAALSAAAGKDVATPFRTFVNQPGVPLVEASLRCDAMTKTKTLHLKQSRHLPVGSAGDPNRVWQIPVCAKYPDGAEIREACTLLTTNEGDIDLPAAACPEWVMPNARAAGYYVFGQPVAELAKLTTKARGQLAETERLAVAHAMRSAWNRGAPGDQVLAAVEPLLQDANRHIFAVPASLYSAALGWFDAPKERAAIEKQARASAAAAWKGVGWAQPKGAAPDADRALLRAQLLSFMAQVARDPAVRKEAADRGRKYVGYGGDGAWHPEVAERDLLPTCVAIAAEEGDGAFFDHLLTKLWASDDDLLRGQLLSGIAAVRAPALAERARALVLDSRLRPREWLWILDAQMNVPGLREAAWSYLKTNLEGLIAKMANARVAGRLPWIASAFCDRAHATELSALFGDRIGKIDGGPRELAGALEAMNLCAARRTAQEPHLRKHFRMPAPSAAAAPPTKAPAKPTPKAGH